MSGEQAITLYVGNLPWSTTDGDLARLFRQFADVAAARIARDRRTGRSQGYGFVDLAAGARAESVCEVLDGCRLNGRQLAVRPARSRHIG